MTGLEELRKTHEASQRQLCEAIQVGVLALTSLEHRISALRAALLSIIRCGSNSPVCLLNFISILRAVLLTTFMTTLQGVQRAWGIASAPSGRPSSPSSGAQPISLMRVTHLLSISRAILLLTFITTLEGIQRAWSTASAPSGRALLCIVNCLPKDSLYWPRVSHGGRQKCLPNNSCPCAPSGWLGSIARGLPGGFVLLYISAMRIQNPH